MRLRPLFAITITLLFLLMLLSVQKPAATEARASAFYTPTLMQVQNRPARMAPPDAALTLAQVITVSPTPTAAPERTRRPTRTPGPTSTPLTIPPPADMVSINAMIAIGVLSVIIVIIGVLINRNPRH